MGSTSGSILVLIGYIFWQNSSAALGYLSETISNETARGVFEIRLQSKFNMEGILFCRLLVSCLIHVITYVGIIAFCSIVIGFNGNDVFIIILSIIFSFPVLIGMYGMGLIFGCVSVIEKNIGSLIFIVQTLLLLITNTLSPSRNELVNLVPFSPGINIMRDIYMKQKISINSIVMYILVNMIWLLIGCFCFRKALKYERMFGSFDNY